MSEAHTSNAMSAPMNGEPLSSNSDMREWAIFCFGAVTGMGLLSVTLLVLIWLATL